jgi:hypothetical protein
MNERLIDFYLERKGYTADEIEDYKMCAAEDAYDNMIDDEELERAMEERQ